MRANNKKWGTALLSLVLAFSLTLTACGKRAEEAPQDQDQVTSDWENPLSAPRPGSDFVPEIPEIGDRLAAAKAINSDVVGWLQVPGTDLNEAVVQTENNEYYYRRDINKKYSFSGSIWMDHESTVGDGKPESFSQNMILYGHNLGSPQGVKDDPNGVKFAQLLKFDDIGFAREHPYFYFTTDAGTSVFEIFTVFYAEDVLTPVPYHHAAYSSTDYKRLLSDVRNRSQFDYNVDVGLDDKIMTLSTCTYKYGTYTQNPHQRFVVMGKLVDEDEDFYEAAEVQENPDPKAPRFK